MDKKGLTLLELILAMTMLSVILLASGSLNLFVLRSANVNAEDTRLQHQVEYVLKDMEMNLLASKEPEVQIDLGEERLQVLDQDDQPIRYSFLRSGNTFEVVRCLNANCQTLSEGVITNKLASNGVTPIPIFSIRPNSNEKLIEVNLAAQVEKQGKIVRIDSASRLYFLRGESTSV